MFSFFAAAIAVRKRGLEFASPPPMRAAIVISRMILVNTRPRFASVAAFLCLIVAHFECPDMTIPLFWPAASSAVSIFGWHPATAKEWTRGSFYPHCGVTCAETYSRPPNTLVRTAPRTRRNLGILAHLNHPGNRRVLSRKRPFARRTMSGCAWPLILHPREHRLA